MINFLIKKSLVIFFLIVSANAEILKKIEINGNKRISDESIIIFSDLKTNKEVSKFDLNTAIKNLYKTNFFSNITFSLENQILIINIEENPIIDNFQITGIKKQSLVEFIKGKIQLAEMKSFDEEILTADLNLINNILKSSGYYFADITSSKSLDEKLNSVNLKINIELGEKAKIKKIIFLGDKVFKDKRLKEVITSEEHKFWKFVSNNVYINRELINLDKRLLTNYFKDNGYFNVKIENSFVEFDKDSNFNLIFNITSGKKYNFNDFSLNLPANFDSKTFDPITKRFSKLKVKLIHYQRLTVYLKKSIKLLSLNSMNLLMLLSSKK